MSTAQLVASVLSHGWPDPSDLERLAVHEAGHAMVAYRMGCPVRAVSIAKHRGMTYASVPDGWKALAYTLGGQLSELANGWQPLASRDDTRTVQTMTATMPAADIATATVTARHIIDSDRTLIAGLALRLLAANGYMSGGSVTAFLYRGGRP